MSDIYITQTKTLKEALYDTIHHSRIPPKAIAEQLDMALSYLYRAATEDPDMGNESATGVRFPAKQIVPLVRITGDYQVMDLMEFQLGRVAIPIPESGSLTIEDIRAQAMRATIEYGELIKKLEESIADGVVTDKEQQQIEKEGMDAVKAIMLLISANKSL
ncbi:phage regulatory CII family protein [Desulforhopalus singaporensis]|uniref:Phage regulatory protein CII (CP76) n=1 Tax=Desulforhopalus singaporensis TaxID=91360 RepID=A0A1H0RI93_9BACT|nr:phage regulatory CII family protein [Desulforhopalus singaporensis]SDP29161.1 Phage regulatory protein CII (CP76) [Desulforhopalus singaporensis]